MQFSLLNSSDIKMVPQYCSYGSPGMPVVPETIFMSGPNLPNRKHQIKNLYQTKASKPDLPNLIYQTEHTKPKQQSKSTKIKFISPNRKSKPC